MKRARKYMLALAACLFCAWQKRLLEKDNILKQKDFKRVFDIGKIEDENLIHRYYLSIILKYDHYNPQNQKTRMADRKGAII